MDLELNNRNVVIVGGSSGIGAACVQLFLEEGANVLNWDIQSPEESDAPHVAVDIADAANVESAIDETSQYFSVVDHVVHTAAVGSGRFGAPFTNLSPDDWPRVFDVNMQGMVNVAHAFAPLVAAEHGTFVFISSVAGQIGSPTDPPYSASKAAGINFAQVMARDLAGRHIRVNTVCPGMVKTPLNRSVWQSWNDQQALSEQLSYDDWAEQKIRALVPLGRWQEPVDIARTVLFLSSECASQITGQTINVDGGYVMHW